jgi:hypothetical protein
MSKIYSSENISIVKKNKSFILEVKNTQETTNKLLFDSLQVDKLHSLISKTECTKDKKCSIEFKAKNILMLKKLVNSLDYKELVKLFLCLKKQISYLHEKNYGILFFNINDIVAIENNDSYYFMYLNSSNLYTIEDNILNVTQSFNKRENSCFIPPELFSFNAIPFQIHYKVSFFSLSMVIAYLLEGKKVDYTNPTSWNIDDFVKICEPIDNTKLFWALMRCQNNDPNKRFLLWI